MTFTYTPEYRTGLTFTWEGGEYISTNTGAVVNVWEISEDGKTQGPRIERTQEAFEAACDEWIREQNPADGEIGGKVSGLPLSLLLRADGVTISSELIAMGTDASGWVHREYRYTLGYQGRTFEGVMQAGGEEGDAPELEETVWMVVSDSWNAEIADSYEDWASGYGGPNPDKWMSEEDYNTHLDNARKLREFLGGARFERYAMADNDV